MGCFAPPRHHVQYFYALLPFLVMTPLIGLSYFDPRRGAVKLAAAAMVLFSLPSLVTMAQIAWAVPRRDWGAVETHRLGLQVRDLAGTGKVLTLGPIVPLEGGLDIYPAFATGPFAWRSAHVVPAVERRKAGIVSPFDLDALLANDPPHAILLEEWDVRDNKPLEAYARAHGYEAHPLSFGTLWRAPAAP